MPADTTQARDDWEGLTDAMTIALRWYAGERDLRPNVSAMYAVRRRGLAQRVTATTPSTATPRGLAALAYGRSLEGR